MRSLNTRKEEVKEMVLVWKSFCHLAFIDSNYKEHFLTAWLSKKIALKLSKVVKTQLIYEFIAEQFF